MLIYLGADHKGFDLKERIKNALKEWGYSEVYDVGGAELKDDDDYPDVAALVAREVSKDPENTRGMLACGSGAGVDIVANKFRGVRSVLAISADQVFDARRDDNVNVLSLSADAVDSEGAQAIVRVFLNTPFAREERFVRRLEKISKIEDELSQ